MITVKENAQSDACPAMGADVKAIYIWRINNVLQTIQSDKFLRRMYHTAKDFAEYEELYGESELHN